MGGSLIRVSAASLAALEVDAPGSVPRPRETLPMQINHPVVLQQLVVQHADELARTAARSNSRRGRRRRWRLRTLWPVSRTRVATR